MGTKRKPIPKRIRIAVWDKYFDGRRSALCYVCNKNTISIESFECAHIIAHALDGSNTCDNLIPCCSLCNKSMQTTDLYEFKSRLELLEHVECVDRTWTQYIIKYVIVSFIIFILCIISYYTKRYLFVQEVPTYYSYMLKLISAE
jgi:hypothetical protein